MYTDDCYTLRIPRLTGWRTLAVNAALVLAGAYLILATGHAEAGAVMSGVALLNIIMRLCTRTAPARSADMLGVLWRGECEPLVAHEHTHVMATTGEPYRLDRVQDAQLITELAEMLDPPPSARTTYRASTVILAGLGAFWMSFLCSFAAIAMVL